MTSQASNAITNLRGWLNEPLVQDEVISVLKMRQGSPLNLREIANECCVPIRTANRVLLRLHEKGRVLRYKLPMQRHRYCSRRKAVVPYAATRMLFVYLWVADGPAQAVG